MEDYLLRVVVSKMYGVITIDADLQRFFKSNVGTFVTKVAEESSEHNLVWSEVYREFETLMEEKLEDIARSLGFDDIQEFFKALKLELGEDGDGGAGGNGGAGDNGGSGANGGSGGSGGQNRKEARMLSLLVASYDYEKFVALMKIKARKVVQREKSAGDQGGGREHKREDTDSDGETKDGGGEGKEGDGEGDGAHEMFAADSSDY